MSLGTARLALTVIALVMMAATPAGAAPAGAGPEPKFARVGTFVTFHGWSANSLYVAYTRTTEFRRKGRSKRRRHTKKRLHRKIVGGEHAGFGSRVGRDVERFARLNRYAVDAWPARAVAGGTYVFEPAFNRTRTLANSLRLTIDVDKDVGWALVTDGGPLIQRSFDAIYVNVSATLYPSPDGRQAILVMLLDTGWSQDAAVYPVSLVANQARLSPPNAKRRP